MGVPLNRRLVAALVCLTVVAVGRPARAQSAPPTPLTVGPVTFGGYVQLDYLAPLESAPPGAAVGAEGTFDIPRARFGVRGPLGPRVRWGLIADFANGPADDSPLRDAFVAIDLAPAATVRVGQYSIPYSLERITSTAVLEIIDRSVMGTLMTPSRDMGVTVSSPGLLFGWLTYSASIVNGTGRNRRDDNDAKDLVGRVTALIPHVPGLTVGLNGAGGEQPDGRRSRGGIDFNYERGHVRLAVEALTQSVRDGASSARGYYVLGVWHHPAPGYTPAYAGYELAARWVDVDDDDGLLTTHALQFGGNYYVTPQVRVMNNLVVPIGDEQLLPRTRGWSRVPVGF
jgi:hypothetical protein